MIETCGGNVEVWDQTLGCSECGEELWNYPGIDQLGLTVEQYEERFFERHPHMFTDCHDHGDEDPHAHEDEPLRANLLWWLPTPYPTRGGQPGYYMGHKLWNGDPR